MSKRSIGTLGASLGLSLGLAWLGLLSPAAARADAALAVPGPSVAPGRAEQVRQAPVVVVSGSADHMDQVLRRAQVRFVVVSPEELPGLPLHSQQVLMVNCRGVMSKAAQDRVRRFVAAGGVAANQAIDSYAVEDQHFSQSGNAAFHQGLTAVCNYSQP